MPCAPPPGRGFYGGGGSSGGGGLGLFSGKGGGRGFFSGKGGGGGGFFRRRGSDDPPHTNGGSGVNGSSMSTNGGVHPAGLREQLIMAHSRDSDSSFAYAGSRTPAQPATEAIPCHVLERLYQECVDERNNKSCEFYFQKLSICSTKSDNAPPMPSRDVGRNGGVAPEHLEPCYHSERVYQGCLKKWGSDHIACQQLNRSLFNCRQHSSLVGGMVP